MVVPAAPAGGIWSGAPFDGGACQTAVMEAPVTVLDRELYTEAAAARLLGLAPSTLHYWLQGGERQGVYYAPIMRPEPVDRRWVTWAEFIEAGWLSEYRKRRRVPMLDLRNFIERLRDEMQVSYPLAHQRPFVSGKKLVTRAQQEAQLAPEYHLMAVTVDGQIILTAPGHSFVERVDWSGDLARGWRPHDDRRSPVRVSPDVRFGRPAVGGVSTLAIFEQSEAGASHRELADDFELSETEVRWALAYENTRHAA